MQKLRIIWISLVLGLLSPATSFAQEVSPFVCGAVDGMSTDLEPGFGCRVAAFLWLNGDSRLDRVSLGTLDAATGFTTNANDWAGDFAYGFGLDDDMGLGYDPESEGPLFVATVPCPAHDLTVSTDRGEVMVRMPDTMATRFGASFVVAEDGATYWAEADHDGIAYWDPHGWATALTGDHLARGADEAAPEPGTPTDPGPAPVSSEAGSMSARAFTAASDGSPVRLGDPDGGSLSEDDVPFAFGSWFDVYDAGDSVGTTSWQGPTGRGYPLQARYQDLSDCAGWPDVEVLPGALAVDPRFGRFAFSEGNPDQEVAVRSHFYQHWNSPYSLVIDGEYAYINIGESDASLVVLQIHGPDDIELVGKTSTGWSYGLLLVEDHAYVRRRGGITVADVADPIDPVVTSELELSWSTPNNVFFHGDQVVATFADALCTLDTTVVAEPAEDECVELPIEDELPDWGNDWFGPISDTLGMAKVTDGDLLRFYDISDPLAPVHLSTVLYSGKGLPPGASVMHPDEPVLYLGTAGDGLKSVDLTDPSAPWVEQVYRAYDVDPDDDLQRADHTTHVIVIDGSLYESGHYGWVDPTETAPWDGAFLSFVRKYDISDPLAPVLLEEWQDDTYPGYLWGWVEHEDYVVAVQQGWGIRTLDATADPTNFLGDYKIAGQTTEVELAGDVAFISGYLGGGITAVDVSDPDEPTEMGYIHHGLDTYGLGLKHTAGGTWVYSSGKSTVWVFGDDEWRYTELTVHDVTDPTDPRFVTQADGTIHLAVDVHGDLLYGANKLWDISDPEAPVILHEGSIGGGEAAAPVGDHLVYGSGRGATGGSVFESGEDTFTARVYDVGIRVAPMLTGWTDVHDASGGPLTTNVVVRGDVAYFTTGSGVVAVDVSDPCAPTVVDAMGDPGCPEGADVEALDVAGDYLYTNCQHWISYVHDISQGLSGAQEVGVVDTHVNEITRLHGYQMLTSAANGLYLIDVPRSPDTPAGPVTVSYHVADEPPGDPADCGDDDDDDDVSDDDDTVIEDDDCSCDASGLGGQGTLTVALIACVGLVFVMTRRRNR